MLDLPNVEDSCLPEEGVTSVLVCADVPHHTPSLVSETLNGIFAYLRHVCLLTHTTVHPAASKLVEPETTKVDPVETSSKSDYLEALPGLNLRRSQFAEQQPKDYWCTLAFKFLSSGGDKANLSRIPQKHLQWAQHFSKHTTIINGVLMYRDELMDNPNHYRYVVPDDIQLRQHLLQAHNDSPLAMHRGREATYESLSNDFYWRNMSKHVRNCIHRCPDCICFKTNDQRHGPMQVYISMNIRVTPWELIMWANFQSHRMETSGF